MKSDVVTRRPVVLVFDDSEICLDIVEVALEEAGFRVVCEQSGKAPDVRLLECQAECVVLDISMPDGDTRTMAEKMRAAKPVPIILHSDRPTAELAVHVQACQAFAAVPKTSDGEDLVSAVRKALGLDAHDEDAPTSIVESSR